MPDTHAATRTRPLPVITSENRDYWEAARQHRLVLQQCSACAHWQFPARAVCTSCFGDDLVFQPAAGTGTVYSYTVVYRPPEEAFAHLVPYVVAIVELDEGVRMMTHVVGIDGDPEIGVGRRVRVDFDRIDDSVTLPVFRLAE